MCLANISRKNTNYSLGSLWIRLRYQNTKYSAASHSDFTLPPPTLSGVSTSESTRLGTPLYCGKWSSPGVALWRGKSTSTGQRANQYWSPISTSTGRSCDQYCSAQWPVLLRFDMY